ncbi:MAG: hypothetical protein LBR25_09150 [Erysipelotrichaceae bacterium]|jgi:hypothetical protein|nr:hypothetical protein [Erysipelotrichaceae bacterium]
MKKVKDFLYETIKKTLLLCFSISLILIDLQYLAIGLKASVTSYSSEYGSLYNADVNDSSEDMGTFNFSPDTDWLGHTNNDVCPYFSNGNDEYDAQNRSYSDRSDFSLEILPQLFCWFTSLFR